MELVVVGSGLAGVRAVERARRESPSARITLVGDETHPPYDRPPLSKGFLTSDPTPDPTPLRKDGYGDLGVTMLAGASATCLQLDARRVGLADGRAVTWDRLVIASGSRPRTTPTLVGAGIYSLRSVDDAVQLRQVLRRVASVVVVGAGVLGSEISGAARSLGVATTLVEPLEQPMVRVAGRTIGAMVAGLHRAHGVDLRLGVGVSAVSGPQGDLTVTLDDGTEIHTEAVVSAIGSVPNTEWLTDSGLEIRDGVRCDATGTTSHPDVLAAGDVARMPHPAHPDGLRLEHWTHAADTGALAGCNALRPRDERVAHDQPPYFWSDQYGLKLQCLGAPAPGDEVRVVLGSLEDNRFLAVHVADGRVTAVSGIGHAGPLNRSREIVRAGAHVDDLGDRAPWA